MFTDAWISTYPTEFCGVSEESPYFLDCSCFLEFALVFLEFALIYLELALVEGFVDVNMVFGVCISEYSIDAFEM